MNLLTPELKSKVLDIIFDYHVQSDGKDNILNVTRSLTEKISGKSGKSWDVLNRMLSKVSYNKDIIYEYFICNYVSETDDPRFMTVLDLYFKEFMFTNNDIKFVLYNKIKRLLKENGIELHNNTIEEALNKMKSSEMTDCFITKVEQK